MRTVLGCVESSTERGAIQFCATTCDCGLYQTQYRRGGEVGGRGSGGRRGGGAVCGAGNVVCQTTYDTATPPRPHPPPPPSTFSFPHPGPPSPIHTHPPEPPLSPPRPAPHTPRSHLPPLSLSLIVAWRCAGGDREVPRREHECRFPKAAGPG